MKSFIRRHWQNRRDSILLPVFLLAIVLATVGVGTVMTWNLTMQRMEDSLHEQVSNQAETFADKLDSKFAMLSGLGTVFGKEELENSDFVFDKLEECAKNTDFLSVYFAYPDGTTYRDNGSELDISDRWYFAQCMKGKQAIEHVEEGKVTGEPCFELAVPVIIDDNVEGVIVGEYSEEKFCSIFEMVSYGISDFSYLCDTSGDIMLITPEAEAQLKGQGNADEDSRNIFTILSNASFVSGSKAYIDELVEQKKGGSIIYEYLGNKKYAVFEPTGINDWYSVVVLPESQIYVEALETASISYIMLAAVLIATVLIIIYLVMKYRRRRRYDKAKAEELRYILEHDDLTGVLSEKTFLNVVSKKLKEIGETEYCLVYMDVYKFKLINEMFGYEKGDEFLCVMAEELQKMTDALNGACGRISGDKFVLFLPHRKEVIDEFYTKKLKNPRILPIEIFLHYGIYVIKNTEIPVTTMVDCAQLAQRSIKGNYDNYVAYYDEKLKQQILREQEVLNSMEAALKNGEFIIYLQPQYNYKDGSVSGAEALVRWNSPAKGLIPPGEFIPIFEKNGFIIKLDENVWEQACKLLRSWIDSGKKPFPISVNVSRTDVLRGSVAKKLKRLIDKYELDPDLLRVEITESAYMDNPQQLIMEINELRENGFLVEMDDFGSGYSSLNMLKDVPINVLKTDLKFLDSEGIEGRRDQILDHVIHMAHQIGLLVVAEGVETKAQADYLVNLDCQIMQGYYFSKPVPVSDFENLVYGLQG